MFPSSSRGQSGPASSSMRPKSVKAFAPKRVPARARAVAQKIAADLRTRKSIMGVFDEGCMGMYNAIVPDDLLFSVGVCKERLSQSALYYAATQVTEAEAREVFEWYKTKGFTFHFGTDDKTELTEAQVLWQCRTYIAACRLADEFGYQTVLEEATIPLLMAH